MPFGFRQTLDVTNIDGYSDEALRSDTLVANNIPPYMQSIPDVDSSHKWGFNPAITAIGGEQVIWHSSETWTPLASAEIMSVVSASTDDAAGGTGMQTLGVYGLDENDLEVNEVVTLNGTTPVLTTNRYSYIKRAIVVSAGSNARNVGIITLTSADTSSIQAVVAPTDGCTQQMIYKVPANKTAFIEDILFLFGRASGSRPRITIIPYIRNNNGSTYVINQWFADTNVSNSLTIRPTIPLKLNPCQMIYFKVDTSQDNTEVAALMSVVEVKNEVL